MTIIDVKPWSYDLGYIALAGLSVNRGDKVVIALHGYLDNANSMIDLAGAFPHHHFIAIDLAGHGQSGHRPPGAHYNQMDYVQDLHQLVEALGVDNVILVGHSLGGIIASIYASSFPERVEALISIDAFGPLTKSTDTTVEQLRAALSSRANKMVPSTPRPISLDAAVKARAASTDLGQDLCRRILSRNVKSETGKPDVWHSDSRLRTQSWLRFTSKQAQAILENIQCSVLVIAASGSFKALAKTYENRGGWIKCLTFEMLTGGHHIHLEQTESTCSLIQEFVTNLSE